MKKYKINRETLDYYIYQLGFEEALEYLNISEKAANNILFNPVINQIKLERVDNNYLNNNENKYDDIIEEIDDDYRKYIIKKYNQQRKKIKLDNKVDVNSNTNEDRLHNHILKMMEKKLIQNTKEINKSLKNSHIDAKRKQKTTNKYKLSQLDNDVEYSIEDKIITDELIEQLKNKFGNVGQL